MKRFSRFINEAKLSQSQRDKLDDLILNVHMTTHPEYDGDEEPTKYLNMIRKEFGDKVAKQVSDGIEKVHWGRDNHSGGHDKLAWRKGGARITKSGKMNAQDVKALKNRIKRDKAWGGITKAVKLPEEVEQLDELSPNTLHSYIKGASKDLAKRSRMSGYDDKRGNYADGDKNRKRANKRMAGIASASGRLADKANMAENWQEKNESNDLDEKYKDPWAAPRKGSSAWHAAQQRKKAERDPEEVKRVNAIGNKNHMVGTAKITHNEAVEVSHDRYMRSHGKKASGGEGNWMFTHKRMGDANVNDPKEVHSARGKFSDAKKSAQQWAKKHGHSTVYVMEEVELDEVSDKKLDAYRQKAFADQPSGDDGSDKYRKRKFGRDLAFAKQTGRAKVLATKEEVEPDEDDYDKGEYDYEGEMTKTQLRTLADAALELHDMLEDDENLPEWIQSKITKAADYVDSARDYMISQWAADEDDDDEEEED